MSEIAAAVVGAVLAWLFAKRLQQPQAQYVYCQDTASVLIALDRPPGPITLPTYEHGYFSYAVNMALPRTQLQCNNEPVSGLTVIQLKFWNATTQTIKDPKFSCTLADDARVLMVERYKAKGQADPQSMEKRELERVTRLESVTFSSPTNDVIICVDELFPHFNSEDVFVAELYVEGSAQDLDVFGRGKFDDGSVWSVSFRRRDTLAARRRFWGGLRFMVGLTGFIGLFVGYAVYAVEYPVGKWLTVDTSDLVAWLTRPTFILLSVLLILGLVYALMVRARWFTIPLPRRRFIYVLIDRRAGS